MGRSGALSVLKQLRVWTLVVLALLFRDSQARHNHCCLAYSISPRGGIKAQTSRPPTLAGTRVSPWHAATPGVRGREGGGGGGLRSTAAASAPGGDGGGQAGLDERQEDEGKTGVQGQEAAFEWTRQWYPVVVMRDLEARDPRQPYPVKLLGESLVVWKDPKDDGWKAFTDKCPHRWAPLSEGRVNQETGRLHCIYHGWEFEGDGKCGSIPQANPDARDIAQNSNRQLMACATVLPTQVVQGKLWVWPDSSPEGVKASESVAPVVVPNLDLDNGDWGSNWYARDLAYGFDTLVENLVDPAHIPFAHHGVIGQRAQGSPMAIELEELAPGEEGFLTKPTGYSGRDLMRVSFRPPGLVYYENDYTKSLPFMAKGLPPPLRVVYWAMKKFNLDKRVAMERTDRDPSDRCLFYFIGYAVPTSPGRCRIFTRSPRNFFLQHPVIPRRWRNSLAGEHLGQHKVLDGDSTALHVQERYLLNAGQQGVKQPERTFYMPTQADVTIRAFRKWYNSRGGGGPPWAQGVDPSDLGPVLPREEILDRMVAHTKDCSACGKAYRVSGRVKKAAVGGALLFLTGAAVAPRGALALKLAAGALANAGLAVAMAKRQQEFVFVDYVHYDRE
ncbi:unnamed protein product [Ectocarpus sp. CCAP 1310/34]|nr:unnamed protein product [Ectocarpus sp. CCAP 1310/34]